jgi:sialidase-1
MSYRLVRFSWAFVFLFITGCKSPGPLARNSANRSDIIETILAPSAPTHPRQTEGDIVVLKNGTLLAAWSDFTGGRRDEATAQISAAKSNDGGRTWSAPFVLQENIGKNNVMSVSFLRVRSGEILFFFLVKNSLSDLKLLVRRSHDEAKTWSAPVVITPDPGYFIMNNARAVQLKSGRILCPISFCPDIKPRDSHLLTVLYFSDDNGHTWQRGKDTVDVPKRGAMEPHVVQLKNGAVLQIIRTQLGQIWSALSSDGGDTWSQAAPFGVVTPEAPSTIVRMPDRGELLLVYNPKIETSITSMNARTPLVCALSKDEGKTWSKPKTIEASPEFTYAYTSVTFAGNRALERPHWHV